MPDHRKQVGIYYLHGPIALHHGVKRFLDPRRHNEREIPVHRTAHAVDLALESRTSPRPKRFSRPIEVLNVRQINVVIH